MYSRDNTVKQRMKKSKILCRLLSIDGRNLHGRARSFKKGMKFHPHGSCCIKVHLIAGFYQQGRDSLTIRDFQSH